MLKVADVSLAVFTVTQKATNKGGIFFYTRARSQKLVKPIAMGQSSPVGRLC